MQLQEVIKVVTISVQTLLITVNYCLSNTNQSVYLFKIYEYVFKFNTKFNTSYILGKLKHL